MKLEFIDDSLLDDVVVVVLPVVNVNILQNKNKNKSLESYNGYVIVEDISSNLLKVSDLVIIVFASVDVEILTKEFRRYT